MHHNTVDRFPEQFVRPSFKLLLNLMAVLLLAKTFAATVLGYSSYLPPDFDSGFLAGRELLFTSTYAAAFYTHITCGPIAILLATFLWLSGKKNRQGKLHRIAGRMLAAVVMLGLVPSGVVMGRSTFGGPVAELAFYAHALVLSVAIVRSIRMAQDGKIRQHRVWSDRTLLLLLGPLALRITGGLLDTLGVQSPAWYQANTWLSWVVPLLVYEIIRYRAQVQPRNSHVAYRS